MSFQSCCIPCLKNYTALACYIFDTHHLSICRSLSPRLDEEQLSAAQFWDSNRHHQRRGERWPTTQQAFSSDVTLLHIAQLLNAIVLQVNWRRYSEHFFVRVEDKVDSMFRKQCRFRDTVYSIISMTEETQLPGFMFSQAVQRQLIVRKDGITNHHFIAYSLSNISAKNFQNRLRCVEVIVCYISVVCWDTV